MTREGPFWDVMAGRAAPPPAATLLGWELVAIDPEAGTIEVAFRPASRIWSSSATGIGRSAKDRTLRREVIASQVCMLPSVTSGARTAARAARPTSSARTLRPVRRLRRAGLRDGRAPPG